MLGGAWPGSASLVLALLYSLGAHGIMTLNDFKSIEGDTRMGVGSLPVRLGAARAARTAAAVMALPQLAVAGLLTLWGLPWHALAVLALTLAQAPLMARFVRAPVQQALLLSALGVPLYVSGMMVSAFGLRQLQSLGVT
jgi:chlorophyll synthase